MTLVYKQADVEQTKVDSGVVVLDGCISQPSYAGQRMLSMVGGSGKTANGRPDEFYCCRIILMEISTRPTVDVFVTGWKSNVRVLEQH